MKAFIAFLLLTVSTQSFAFYEASQAVSVISYMMSSSSGHKEAREVLADYTQFEATGKLTENLSKRITDVRTIEPKLSANDALDVIVEAASKIVSESEKNN